MAACGGASPDVLRLTGRWLVAAEVAAAHGVTDEHGHLPASNRPAILGEPVPTSLEGPPVRRR